MQIHITTNFTEQVKNIVLQETGKEGNAVNVSLKLELGEVPANSDIYAVSSALDYTLSFDWQQTTAAE